MYVNRVSVASTDKVSAEHINTASFPNGTGIGIDDMFVLVQCLNNLPDEYKTRRKGHEDEEEVEIRAEAMGRTMKHAGVAVTVTSVTDITAFVIGSTGVSKIHWSSDH